MRLVQCETMGPRWSQSGSGEISYNSRGVSGPAPIIGVFGLTDTDQCHLAPYFMLQVNDYSNTIVDSM